MKSLIFILSDSPNVLLMLLGIALIVCAVIIIIKSMKKKSPTESIAENDSVYKENDVLGLEKPVTTNTDTFTLLGKVIQWKMVLLVVLIIFGIYLIYSNRPNYSEFKGSNDPNKELKKSDK